MLGGGAENSACAALAGEARRYDGEPGEPALWIHGPDLAAAPWSLGDPKANASSSSAIPRR